MKSGFIGLGHMGSVMAENLAMVGHDATVFNRTPGRIGALVQPGAHAATDIAGACHGQFVITMLSEDAAVAEIAMASDNGHPVRIVDHPEPQFSPQEIVRRAQRRV
jgi:3-hydroxyisobutyrate dehydrogenase-like beta-hydroxyacid dehydrogenase